MSVVKTPNRIAKVKHHFIKALFSSSFKSGISACIISLSEFRKTDDIRNINAARITEDAIAAKNEVLKLEFSPSFANTREDVNIFKPAYEKSFTADISPPSKEKSKEPENDSDSRVIKIMIGVRYRFALFKPFIPSLIITFEMIMLIIDSIGYGFKSGNICQ